LNWLELLSGEEMGLVNEVRHNSLLKLVIVVLYLVAVVSSAGDEESLVRTGRQIIGVIG
jgi:hypothetical protein